MILLEPGQEKVCMSEEIFRALSEKDLYEEGVAEVKDGEIEVAKEEVWTVSTKTRRLAPAFTLSRKDLGADSARNIAHDNSAAKKKGLFTLNHRFQLCR